MERAQIIEVVAERLSGAQRVFVLTGAGIGVASGLSTFRGPDGLFSERAASTARTRWRNHSFEQLASLAGFENDPELVWSWYNERIVAYLVANPNAGHRALAELEALAPRLTIATQNVDRLQARAGSRRVLEIHGSIFDVKCTGACVPRGRWDAPAGGFLGCGLLLVVVYSTEGGRSPRGLWGPWKTVSTGGRALLGWLLVV